MTFVKFKESYNVKTTFLSYQSAISAIKSYLESFDLFSNDIQTWTLPYYQYFRNQKKVKTICIMFSTSQDINLKWEGSWSNCFLKEYYWNYWNVHNMPKTLIIKKNKAEWNQS